MAEPDPREQAKLDAVTTELAGTQHQLLRAAAAVIAAEANEIDLARFRLANREKDSPEGEDLSELIHTQVLEVTKAAIQAVVSVYVKALNLSGEIEQ